MNKDCWKKVIGNRPPSSATPNELRRIEKCSITAAGGNYIGPLKDKKRKGSSKMKNLYKSPDGR